MDDTLLLVMPVPQYQNGTDHFFELQGSHGLEMWCQNFSKVTIASPSLNIKKAEKHQGITWKNRQLIASKDKLSFVPLPDAYFPTTFFKEFSKTRLKLKNLIQEHHFLHFAIGGFFGDWGSVAANLAHQLKRPYSVHMDWISHRVMVQTLSDERSLLKKCKRVIHSKIARHWNDRAIKHAYTALCNGQTCFNYYQKVNPNSHKIYDIHIGSKELATPILITQKKKQSSQNQKLKVCYAGRLDAIKAPLDWLQSIAYAKSLGCHLEAIWYGDGPLRDLFLSEISHLNLKNEVQAPGYLHDREDLLKAISSADLFLMTHITDESPRCVIEAMMRATPVVGYTSAYAKDVLGKPAAGKLTPCKDWKALGKNLLEIDKNRNELEQLITLASKRGSEFTDKKIFQKRSHIIKNEILNGA